MRPTLVLVLAIALFWTSGAEAILCAHGKKKIVRVRTGACSGNETPVAANDLGQGPQGDTGPAGPITGVLPSGVTLRGTFGIDFGGTATTSIGETAISFGLTLASAPTPIVRMPNAAPNDDCPGTVASPEAAPGRLCLYQGTVDNVAVFSVYTADNIRDVASTFGALLIVTGSTESGRIFVDGSWAVTAP